MNLATIDVGTNTTLLLVVRLPDAGGNAGIQVLEERAEITRLGRGIGHGGKLGAEGIARTLDALRSFAQVARGLDAKIVAVGTEGLRRAPNAVEFLEPAAALLGAEVQVIDGAREAALTFGAVAASFPEVATGAAAIVDIGGGSTEIIVTAAGRPGFRTSIPIGSVRLTEGFIRRDPPSREELDAVSGAVDAALAGVPFPPRPAALIGVAGTVTSLAAMALDLGSYDSARVHGHRLTRAELGRQLDRLRTATQPQREQMRGLDPRRADVIVAGALILDRVAAAAGVTEIIVSDRGVRWGLVYEFLEPGRTA
jgi:exopolyphosphatase/guanosine-5'-triphosphate,3'-diphosphate pyrophosphatase